MDEETRVLILYVRLLACEEFAWADSLRQGNGNDDRSGFDLGGQSAAIVQHGCFLRLAVTSCMLKFVRDSNQPDDGVDRDLMICLFTSEASSNEFVRGRLASWPSVAEATVSIGISGH